ncbi:MAG: extracellular solute-binding protein [Pseudomonadota bacterium]
MDTLALDWLTQVFAPLLDPKKRLFIGYLAGAIVIAVVVQMIVARRSPGQSLRDFFSPKVWWSSSARGDYKLLVLNKLIMMGVVPRLISRVVVATLLFELFHIWFDGRIALWPTLPAWVIASAFTLTLFLLDDATKYLLHRALHRWPLLWSFHQVHHSAETLTPVTVYRTHPVEAVLFALRSTLVQAVVMAVFLFFFAERTTLVTIIGANVFLFLFNVAGANLRHSHVWITYGQRVERWLISPAQHQIHHSLEARHHDRNFGAVLAVWDRLGGSLCLARGNRPQAYGVDATTARPHTLATLYLAPFQQAFKILRHRIQQGRRMFSGYLKERLSRSALLFSVATLVALVAVSMMWSPVRAAGELNIYSHRQPFLIKPFIDAYTAETGTKVNVVYASKGLAQRLQSEGARSPADVVLTVDIARLNVYADKDLLAPVNSETLTANIPTYLRDTNNRWFGFSKRARVIAISKQAKDAANLKRYEDLADPRWKGRICSRPGSHVYNRALVASVIETSGLETAEAWAKSVVDNLARRPQGNDRAQVKAIFEGQCDVGIINNYYFGKLKSSENPAQREWAEAVTLLFPNQDDRGTHINISGGGVAKFAPHKAEAIRFLEFLTSPKAQKLYSTTNYEFPVNPTVRVENTSGALPEFKEDEMPIARISARAGEAQKVIDRVGW